MSTAALWGHSCKARATEAALSRPTRPRSRFHTVAGTWQVQLGLGLANPNSGNWQVEAAKGPSRPALAARGAQHGPGHTMRHTPCTL